MKKSTALIYLLLVAWASIYTISTNDGIYDLQVMEYEKQLSYYQTQLGYCEDALGYTKGK